MLAFLERKKLSAKPAVSLSPKEVEEFMKLLDEIENEQLWNVPLHIAVGDYMLRTGTTYPELMRRYEAVCPDYRKKDFPLQEGLRIAGTWMERYRPSIVSQIYIKASAGKPFSPKDVIQHKFQSIIRG
ncbi:hypothetical protein HYW58_00210 [Candidatus Kaiserbacteria bacterium]|nr:hypothetical protein [Candidatus Kaiserbacteria bacterium]